MQFIFKVKIVYILPYYAHCTHIVDKSTTRKGKCKKGKYRNNKMKQQNKTKKINK